MKHLRATVELEDGTKWDYLKVEGMAGPTVRIEPEGVYVNEPRARGIGRETFLPMHRVARVTAETDL
jgi:hypothetical protein